MVNKIMYYSDFYDKSYCQVKIIGINRRNRNHTWYDCKVIDNSHIDAKRFYGVGTKHSITDCWLYPTFEALKAGSDKYKETQINCLKSLYNLPFD
jgi:hypothetical protein